ncbi:fibroblast growth factor 5 [Ornithorhynchus anatinus]|uniref:fibroblast growth factor 5 n=1 Tax=Ornithorhynchus anatinus TaxID=9258 RepID=UPI0010A92928|nr:fibroblast growth factor 5 [Ornithorhynchus anatinus]
MSPAFLLRLPLLLLLPAAALPAGARLRDRGRERQDRPHPRGQPQDRLQQPGHPTGRAIRRIGRAIRRTARTGAIRSPGCSRGIRRTARSRGIRRTGRTRGIRRTARSRGIRRTGRSRGIRRTGRTRGIRRTGLTRGIRGPGRSRTIRRTGGRGAGRRAGRPGTGRGASRRLRAGPSGRRTGRLYCRAGIGFHLQLHPDGRVSGSHEADPLSVLEIFAVSQGIVGIRGVFSNTFLAMSKKGKLHASAKFSDDCKFRERFQENSYNTYASAIHRTEKTGREWYVALNKRGKAKRGCSPRVKAQHVSTHFLPRFKQSEPPELSFTVTVPEKKRPPASPAKPKVPGPRKSSTTVKYKLKFRFG